MHETGQIPDVKTAHAFCEREMTVFGRYLDRARRAEVATTDPRYAHLDG